VVVVVVIIVVVIVIVVIVASGATSEVTLSEEHFTRCRFHRIGCGQRSHGEFRFWQVIADINDDWDCWHCHGNGAD